MKTHAHEWKRIDFFRPLHCFECKCGAACSVIEGRTHYSPRKMFGNRYAWKLIPPPHRHPGPEVAAS